MQKIGWPSLFQWAIAFGLLALTIIGAASIGILVAPFAIGALGLVIRRNRDWPEAPLGGLVGAGAVCLFVAYRNRGYRACPPEGIPVRLGRGQHFSCGGWDPMPWLVIGALMVVAGLLGYARFRRAHRAIT